MARRAWMFVLAFMLLSAAALAEAPYCVVEGGAALLVDGQGNELIPMGACEDLFPVVAGSLYAAGSPGDYALVDAEGQPVAEGRFGMLCADGGAIVFRRGWRYGAMDREGRTLLDPVWTQLTGDGRGGWLALAGNALDEIADPLFHIAPGGESVETGISVLGLLRRVREDRMACCGDDGLWGYVDGGGEMAIGRTWRSAADFEGGYAVVTGEDGCGVIDADGNEVIAPEYEYIARAGRRFALLDGEGRLELRDAITLDAVAGFDAAGAAVAVVGDAIALSDGDGARLIDGDGRVICTASAGASFSAGTGGQYIVRDGAWGEAASWVADADGTAATGKYQRLLPLCEGRYAFMTLQGADYYSDKLNDIQRAWDYDTVRYGMIDAGGNALLPAEYRMIRALDEERLLLMTDDALALADRDGRVIRAWTLPGAGASSGEAGE